MLDKVLMAILCEAKPAGYDLTVVIGASEIEARTKFADQLWGDTTDCGA